MPKFSEIVAWAGLKAGDPDLVVAQQVELQRQIPLLYALLVVNSAAVAYTHYAVAPSYMTIFLPGLLVVACVCRLAVWMKRRHVKLDTDQAKAQLVRTTILGAVLAAFYIVWALKLDQYGSPIERGHVALFIAITTIGIISCLTHLPQAAILVATIVTIPYFTYYMKADDPVFSAIAMNILLVTAVMIQVLLTNFNGFTKLVRSQSDLAGKQAETQRLSDENARLAHTDSLTSLPNRRYFFMALEQMIERSHAGETQFAVGLLDLDRFKPINDTYGHVFGDRLLAEVGVRLREAAGEEIVVARLGGDEFGFIVAGDLADGELMRIGQRVCARISDVFQWDDLPVTIGCSCGLAVYPSAGDTAHTLFDRADYALYHSKSQRNGATTVFSLEHETRIRSERAIEAALQSSNLDAEMDVHFQPIVDMTTGGIVAAEALARWTSKDLGPVRPDQFVAVAERAGMIHALTLMLLRKSLKHFVSFPDGVNLSFNLSAHDITSPETVLSVISIVRGSGIDPRRLSFELTETSVMRNFDVAIQSIGALRALGASIALDDFGTGYSSLGYLQKLPLDKVKIDRSFIDQLHTPSGRNIVKAILGLCENLKLDCIIEGVETSLQMMQLREIGYSRAQGFFYARPMPIEPFLIWAKNSMPEEAVDRLAVIYL